MRDKLELDYNKLLILRSEFDIRNDGQTFVIINYVVERFAVNGQCSDFGSGQPEVVYRFIASRI